MYELTYDFALFKDEILVLGLLINQWRIINPKFKQQHKNK